MITYVEHDAEGNIVHIAEVHTTEGAEVEQQRWSDETLDAEIDPKTKGAARQNAINQLRAQYQIERQQRVDAAVARREAATRAELAAAKTPHAGLIVLPDGAPRPTHDGHKVEAGKVRARTAAERAAWHQA